MKRLETTSKQITETLKENINSQEVYYQYVYDDVNPARVINFSCHNANKPINGTYHVAETQLSVNMTAEVGEDIDLLKAILSTLEEIATNITSQPNKTV